MSAQRPASPFHTRFILTEDSSASQPYSIAIHLSEALLRPSTMLPYHIPQYFPSRCVTVEAPLKRDMQHKQQEELKVKRANPCHATISTRMATGSSGEVSGGPPTPAHLSWPKHPPTPHGAPNCNYKIIKCIPGSVWGSPWKSRWHHLIISPPHYAHHASKGSPVRHLPWTAELFLAQRLPLAISDAKSLEQSRSACWWLKRSSLELKQTWHHMREERAHSASSRMMRGKELERIGVKV